MENINPLFLLGCASLQMPAMGDHKNLALLNRLQSILLYVCISYPY
jgi:hypothetical protein